MLVWEEILLPLWERFMNLPEWLKPGLMGAAAGAAVLAYVGFSWGGWVTGGTAEKLASEQAQLEVVAALVPICLDQYQRDPNSGTTIAELKGASTYQRRDILIEAGWATMPGATEASNSVANACVREISASF
jgi:hypothetical protein